VKKLIKLCISSGLTSFCAGGGLFPSTREPGFPKGKLDLGSPRNGDFSPSPEQVFSFYFFLLQFWQILFQSEGRQ